MKKRVIFSVGVVLLAANLIFAVRLYSEASTKPDKENPYSQMELITRVMELIRKDYVDGEKVSYRDLSYGALKGMLNSLDPHSQFMEPVAYQDMKEDTEGKFGGLGIQIGLGKEGFLTVIAPIEDTPAFRAGILAGDRIGKIDGKPTDRMNVQDAVRQLRGEPGTKVTITVFRAKAKDPNERIKDYTITRDFIKVDSVKDVKMLDNGVGYVRITQFNEPTADEFEKALTKLEGQKMDALVIDLRNNPGGLLESARKIASKFVPYNELIVTTEGRDPANKLTYRSERGNKRLTYPIVLLVNGGSASGSEIVAGALQDLKRAVLVGETTFGKGSVQSILSLPDGSAVRLTTAKYYTPSHKVIHEHGVTPDIIVPVTDEDERKLAEQRARASLPPEEGQEKVEKIPDPQLDRALDLLKGVKLFAKQTKVNKPVTKEQAAVKELVKILGIETSCDETSAAVVVDGSQILSNVVSSQVELHRPYGGVVPELASRNHLQFIDAVIQTALEQAGTRLDDIDAVAATYGPGLASSLLIGLNAGKGLAFALDRPFIGVNHVEAHLYSPVMAAPDALPMVSLIVSGGHTILVHATGIGQHTILGQTIDDAAGEAFDKVAKLLKLGYPGGPEVDRFAKSGNPRAVEFPRSMLNDPSYNFSFSGLKTSVLYYLRKNAQPNVANVCASFQEAVVDVLVGKVLRAAEEYRVRTVSTSGGVSINSRFREKLAGECQRRDLRLLLVPASLCTDNAGMIAALAYHKLQAGQPSEFSLEVAPSIGLGVAA